MENRERREYSEKKRTRDTGNRSALAAQRSIFALFASFAVHFTDGTRTRSSVVVVLSGTHVAAFVEAGMSTVSPIRNERA
jgi:hypothetical protein